MHLHPTLVNHGCGVGSACGSSMNPCSTSLSDICCRDEVWRHELWQVDEVCESMAMLRAIRGSATCLTSLASACSRVLKVPVIKDEDIVKRMVSRCSVTCQQLRHSLHECRQADCSMDEVAEPLNAWNRSGHCFPAKVDTCIDSELR